MKLFNFLALSFFSLYFAGCAAVQPPVSLSSQFFENKNSQVGVVVKTVPNPDFFTEGDVRLLDMAIIAAATAKLREHTKSLDLADFVSIKSDISNILQKKGFVVKFIEEPLDTENLQSFSDPDAKDTDYFAKKDMTPLAQKLGVDFLLSLEVTRAGFSRPYHSMVPLGDPRAVISVHGELVDLRSNRLLWYAGIIRSNDCEGAWDEPPSYPGLTNSYYVTVEQAKREILDILSQKNVNTQSETDPLKGKI